MLFEFRDNERNRVLLIKNPQNPVDKEPDRCQDGAIGCSMGRLKGREQLAWSPLYDIIFFEHADGEETTFPCLNAHLHSDILLIPPPPSTQQQTSLPSSFPLQ